jgi:hypothetical protein
MKRVLGWCAAWTLYWGGDAASRLIGNTERRSDRVVYRIYSALMGWSVNVQDWSGASSPWSKP